MADSEDGDYRRLDNDGVEPVRVPNESGNRVPRNPMKVEPPSKGMAALKRKLKASAELVPPGLPHYLLFGEHLRDNVRIYVKGIDRVSCAAKMASCIGIPIAAYLNNNVAVNQYLNQTWKIEGAEHNDPRIEVRCREAVAYFDSWFVHGFLVRAASTFFLWRFCGGTKFHMFVWSYRQAGSWSVMSAMIPFLSPGRYLAKMQYSYDIIAERVKMWGRTARAARNGGTPTEKLHRALFLIILVLLSPAIFIAATAWVLSPVLGAAACYFKIQQLCPLVGQHWATADWKLVLGTINQLKGIDHAEEASLEETIKCLADAQDGTCATDKKSKLAEQKMAYLNEQLDSAFFDTHGYWGLCLRATLSARDCQIIMRRHADALSSLSHPDLNVIPMDNVSVSTHHLPLAPFDDGTTSWWCDDPSPSCDRRSNQADGGKYKGTRWSDRHVGGSYDLCDMCCAHFKTTVTGAPPNSN
jgi:hypothetical protein